MRTWSLNDNYQLDDSTTTGKSSPILVLKGENISKIVAGCYTSFALTDEGQLWMWDRNEQGERVK